MIFPAITLGEWWRWALLSPDGVAPIRMVGVSASVSQHKSGIKLTPVRNRVTV